MGLRQKTDRRLTVVHERQDWTLPLFKATNQIVMTNLLGTD